MADESGINRISLRVPSELFERLDDKRHAERTTFQEIGLRLLRQWLAESAEPGVRPASGQGDTTTADSSPRHIAMPGKSLDTDSAAFSEYGAEINTLIRILSTGDSIIARAIRENLSVFDALARILQAAGEQRGELRIGLSDAAAEAIVDAAYGEADAITGGDLSGGPRTGAGRKRKAS